MDAVLPLVGRDLKRPEPSGSHRPKPKGTSSEKNQHHTRDPNKKLSFTHRTPPNFELSMHRRDPGVRIVSKHSKSVRLQSNCLMNEIARFH